MNTELINLLEHEIESRARVLAAEMVAAREKPNMPSDIAPNGEVITPFLFDGKKYLSSTQVQSLLGVKYNTLWKWNKKGKLSYHKAGGRLLFLYENIQRMMKGGAL